MVRIGLVVVAMVLVSMVILGVGMGMGLVQVDSHGIAFVQKDGDTDSADGQQPRVVSADELLRQKGISVEEPLRSSAAPTSKPDAPQVAAADKPAPAAPKPAPAPDKPVAAVPTPAVLAGAIAAGAQEPGDHSMRIDAASFQPVRDPRGMTWNADSGFEGGLTVDRGPIAIANTDFPDIYRTERYGMTAWSRPVPNGRYTVRLHFAETSEHVNDGHPRVFHFVVQGQEVKNFNVAKESGGNCRALVKPFNVNVTDGKLLIAFQRVSDDPPEINGIEVIPAQQTIRVDAGSVTAVRDPEGNTWEADSGFDGGQTVDRGPLNFANTHFSELYRTERYGMHSWRRAVANGKYAVRLHFAETWGGIDDGHPRIFHVSVQGQALRDLNIRKEVGGHQMALSKTFHVTVTDGNLLVVFEPTANNVPEINGIEVAPE